MNAEELSEDFFRDLAARVSDRLVEELPSEEELARRIKPSPKFERRMELMLQNPKRARTPKQKVRRVLALAAAIILLLAAAAMSVSAVRKAVFQFFADVYDRFVVVFYQPDSNEVVALNAIQHFRAPAYVPPGYAQTSEEKLDILHIIVYANEHGHELVFEQTILDGTHFGLDFEGEAKTFEINGSTGLHHTNNGSLVMVWADALYAYRLTGLIELEHALKMAENIF